MRTTADPDALPTSPAPARVERDVLRALRDSTLPAVDLHLPTGSTTHCPLVVDVSGHARSDDHHTARWASALAAHGLAVAAVRTLGPARRDIAPHTVRTLVRLLRSNGTPHGPATDRIALFGHGDGAHLAALAAYGTVDTRSRVQALAGVAGSWGADLTPDPDARRRTAVRRHPDAEVLHQVSEIALATGNDVPLLVVHRPDDPNVPAEHGVRFAQVVTAAGGRASVLLGDTGREPAAVPETVAAVAAFFHRVLGDTTATATARRTSR
ncbi:hypothetical protein KNE206_61430 [Kitasatospora sp. NE20-6]|uniref:alpha/beta hydrolase family protein n=1 Tax=Kitasatospora sp. NE20-6 TaxID=2859066 RepID=UPI0034DBB108